MLLQVKASLRKLSNAEARLQAAEGACFQAHHVQAQRIRDGDDPNISVKHTAEALKALQMLLLLLDFPKE